MVSATWDEVAKMILRDRGIAGVPGIIYIKDGKVNVEVRNEKEDT